MSEDAQESANDNFLSFNKFDTTPGFTNKSNQSFHPYTNRRNNNRFTGGNNGFQQGHSNHTPFAPHGFSSPIAGGGYRDFNRRGANFRSDNNFRNRKNFTPNNKNTNSKEFSAKQYFHPSMIQNPWAECEQKKSFIMTETTESPLNSSVLDDIVDNKSISSSDESSIDTE